VASAGAHAASGQPLNLKAFMDDVLDAYDITDKDRYYTAVPPNPQMQGGGGGGGMPGMGMPNGQGGGVTNPALAAGMSSPSNPNSMSPEVFLQRLGSMRGGPANVGG
jgi:hypothetical protein